jgi:hypothetical protein
MICYNNATVNILYSNRVDSSRDLARGYEGSFVNWLYLMHLICGQAYYFSPDKVLLAKPNTPPDKCDFMWRI